jgi:hypothetical protein
VAELIQVHTLTRASEVGHGFDLALPNPILGKTVFVRLPAQDAWRYEVNAAELRAGRNLILRDRMWVTRGEARVVATHANGMRAELSLKITPWHSRANFNIDAGKLSGSAPIPADLRMEVNPFWAPLWRVLSKTPEHRLRIRCHHTERQIEIRARCADTGWSSDVLAVLLAAVRCH